MQVQDVGEPIVIRTVWWDNTGQLADPATITMTITAPDGTANTVTQGPIVRESVGVWNYTTIGSMAGLWRVHTVGTLFDDVQIQDAAVLVGAVEQAGPCDNWCSWEDVLACAAPDEPNEALRDAWVTQATEILWDLTDRFYPGICEVTRSLCFSGTWCGPGYGGAWAFGPYGAVCGACEPWPAVDLGGRYPVWGAWDVVIDGETLDPSAYVVRGHRWLVRLDGQGWPAGWNTADPNAFRATWATGRVPPAGGRAAAATLAAEIAKRCVNDPSCKLPSRVTNVVREGVSFTLLDSLKMLDEGRTGLDGVDQWLVADRLGRKPRPRVFHPAAAGQRRFV